MKPQKWMKTPGPPLVGPNSKMKPYFFNPFLSHTNKCMQCLCCSSQRLVSGECDWFANKFSDLPYLCPQHIHTHTHCKFSNSIIKFTLWLSLVLFLITYGKKRVKGQVVLFLHVGVQRSLQHSNDRALWAFDCEDKNGRLSFWLVSIHTNTVVNFYHSPEILVLSPVFRLFSPVFNFWKCRWWWGGQLLGEIDTNVCTVECRQQGAAAKYA